MSRGFSRSSTCEGRRSVPIAGSGTAVFENPYTEGSVLQGSRLGSRLGARKAPQPMNANQYTRQLPGKECQRLPIRALWLVLFVASLFGSLASDGARVSSATIDVAVSATTGAASLELPVECHAECGCLVANEDSQEEEGSQASGLSSTILAVDVATSQSSSARIELSTRSQHDLRAFTARGPPRA